jgi:tripartite-type tricarboxylate transporter receptor subunit TctC
MKKLLAVLLMSLATVVTAQTFPNKPVKIITSLPVGSGPDTISRKLAEKLSNKWGVPVVVENKPGGNGAVAFGAYADTAADGYTILSGDAGNFVGYPILYNKPEALSTIEPLTGQNMTNMMLVVAPSIKNLAFILSFIGVKMLISGIYTIPIHWALLVVLSILISSVVLSLLFPKSKEQEV